jgi:hypothetical protein
MDGFNRAFNDIGRAKVFSDAAANLLVRDKSEGAGPGTIPTGRQQHPTEYGLK